MKIDSKEILERLKSDRIRRSIFVSESVYKDFQDACDDTSVSLVLEDLMRLFIESAKKKKTTG